MASPTNRNMVRLTCPTCDHTVLQAPGTKRTICPNCGNFYNMECDTTRPRADPGGGGGGGRPHSGDNEEKLPNVNNKNDRERSGGRLGALSSFFKSLHPGNTGSRSRTAASPTTDTGPGPGPGPGPSSRPGSHGTLPPIRQESHGRLTVDKPTNSSPGTLSPGTLSPGTLSPGTSSPGSTSTGPAPLQATATLPPGTASLSPGTAPALGRNSPSMNNKESDSLSRNNFHNLDRRKSPSPRPHSGRRTSPRPHSGRRTSPRPHSGRRTSPRPHSGRRNIGQHPHGQNNAADEQLTNKTIYPVRTRTLEQLRADVKEAKASQNWRSVLDYYSTTFNSVVELNAVFKRDPNKEYKTTDDPGLRFDFTSGIYDILLELPQDIQKVVLKSIINSLLKDKRFQDTSRIWPHTKDDLRAYLILLQNPQFNNLATYVIFAHLIRQVAALHDHDHHFLVHWFKRLEKTRFRQLVNKLHNFISCRLFPPKQQDLPPMAKCTWWIPSATKVLALLNAANNLSLPPLMTYIDFYNSTLDHLDLMSEYYNWQNPQAHGGFTFCQYPFILSISAKRSILQRDSEQQMIIMARRSLVAKVQRRQLPDIGMLFLNLTVRRSHLVSDSLNEIARKQHDLKKKLKVTFAGEPGLDMGGLTKEWFLLLIRQVFQPEYGMFTYDKKSKVYWFSTHPCENYQEFNLVGVLMGLAVYNSIILDIRFPQCCYRKLLSPAVVPYNNPRATVGVAPLSLTDLTQTMPDLSHGLKELMEYEGDVEGDLCMTFQASYEEFSQTRTVTLKEDGENIPVTEKNRKEYIQLYVDHLLNKSIYRQFQAFYHGFHSVCASNALIMLRPEEVETLVCGSPDLNMADLKKVTTLDGYQPNDQTIKNFWEVLLNLSSELQKRFLLFATGSDRVPIGGMSEMTFKITRVENTSMLPMSHTCFNQLVLPAYKQKKTLKTKLIIAIQNAEGFGIE